MTYIKDTKGLVGRRVIAIKNDTNIRKGNIYYFYEEFTESPGYYFLSKGLGKDIKCEGIFCPNDLGVIFKFYNETINNYSIF